MTDPTKSVIMHEEIVFFLKYIPHIWQCICFNVVSCMNSRLLHPKILDGILIGLTPYRLLLDTLSEYPDPWSWKNVRK